MVNSAIPDTCQGLLLMCYLPCVLPRSGCPGMSPPLLRIPPLSTLTRESKQTSLNFQPSRALPVLFTPGKGYSLPIPWREYIYRKSVYDSAVIVLLGSPEQKYFHEDAVQGPRNIVVKSGAYFSSDLFRKKLELRPFFRLSYLTRDWQSTVQDHQNLEKVNLGLPKFS